MASTNDYARLSAAVYDKTDANEIRASGDWEELELLRDDPVTGFAAGVFRHRVSGEIVIAYAGTNRGYVRDFAFGNVAAALGEYSPQVLAAMQLYMRVRRQYAAGDAQPISFTGHSLGGGLASLMAVYFDRPATVFAPAPFELSATRAPLINDYTDRLRVQGLTDAALDRYLLDASFVERELNVTAYSIEGEIVSHLFGRDRTIVNLARDFTIAIGANPASRTDLHSLLLHAAALESAGFLEALRRVPAVVRTIFDRTLEARDPERDEQPDFLHRLMRRHWGIEGAAAGQVLDRFAADVLKLDGDMGLAQTQARDALLAAAVEYYYQQGSPTSFFSVAEGFLSFDLGQLVGNGMLPSLAASKALPRLQQGLEAAFGGDQGYLRYLRQKPVWHLQQGSAAMNFTATAAANDAAVGGVHSDFIDAGAGNDLLVGNAGTDALFGGPGNDILLGGLDSDYLEGGAGNDALRGGADDDILVGGAGGDYLLGGAGADRYEFAAGHGSDIVVDADGAGSLWFEGLPISGGKKVDESYWISDDGRFGFTLVPNGSGGQDLIVSHGTSLDKITIRDWQPSELGILLDTTAAPMPQTPNTIVGVAGEGTRGDQIVATSANDHVVGTSVHDVIVGEAGDDRIEAGAGGDVILGGFGRDRVYGGEGNDAIRGGGYKADGSYFNTMTESVGRCATSPSPSTPFPRDARPSDRPTGSRPSGPCRRRVHRPPRR
jgi:Ca2+-binding RTX toxin-like protein/dienelactone hydrolase